MYRDSSVQKSCRKVVSDQMLGLVASQHLHNVGTFLFLCWGGMGWSTIFGSFSTASLCLLPFTWFAAMNFSLYGTDTLQYRHQISPRRTSMTPLGGAPFGGTMGSPCPFFSAFAFLHQEEGDLQRPEQPHGLLKQHLSQTGLMKHDIGGGRAAGTQFTLT